MFKFNENNISRIIKYHYLVGCFCINIPMEAVDNMLHYVPLFCILSRSTLLYHRLLSVCILNPHIIFIADKNIGNLLTTCF